MHLTCSHSLTCEMGTEELFCKRKSQNLLRPHFAFCKICSVPILQFQMKSLRDEIFTTFR